jgi:hypothetical protein
MFVDGNVAMHDLFEDEGARGKTAGPTTTESFFRSRIAAMVFTSSESVVPGATFTLRTVRSLEGPAARSLDVVAISVSKSACMESAKSRNPVRNASSGSESWLI